MWVSLTTKNRLNGLSHYCPGIFQICIQFILIEYQFMQTLQCTLKSDNGMTHWYAYITQYSRVCQITLKTTYRQLLSQELQDCISNTQVTLAVFIIDRIYLMGHCTRSHLTSFNLLLEVFHGNIHPEITVQVYYNRIYPTHGIKESTKKIIITDLCGILLTLQTELLTYEAIAECLPVIVRISHMMSIIITCSTTKLCCDGHLLEGFQLLFQTIYKYHNFLTQTGWRRWLPMSLSQHWNVIPFLCIRTEQVNKFFYLRDIHIRKCILDGKRNTSVIDVLRSQSKMNEFLVSIKTSYFIKFLLNKILYCFYIVIGVFLYFLHSTCIVYRKVTIDISQFFEKRMIEILKLRQRQFTECDKILYFYSHTIDRKSTRLNSSH